LDIICCGLFGCDIFSFWSESAKSHVFANSYYIVLSGLMVVTGSESPIVVVLSGSMEPAFKVNKQRTKQNKILTII